jgi:hypothetical protein
MRRLIVRLLCGWLVCAGVQAQPAGKSLNLEPGARIGVLYLLAEDLTHYHVGFTMFGNHWKQYAVGWPVRERFERQLTDGIAARGYVAVTVAPSEVVMAERARTFGASTTFGAPGFSRAAVEEYRRLAAAEDLVALVVVAPSLDNTLTTAGSFFEMETWNLPDAISDWGVSTTSRSGRTKPIVFNKSNLMLLDMRPERPRKVKQVWGDNDTMKWRHYEWPEDMQELAPGAFDGARPILESMVDRQIAALLDALQPPTSPP